MTVRLRAIDKLCDVRHSKRCMRHGKRSKMPQADRVLRTRGERRQQSVRLKQKRRKSNGSVSGTTSDTQVHIADSLLFSEGQSSRWCGKTARSSRKTRVDDRTARAQKNAAGDETDASDIVFQEGIHRRHIGRIEKLVTETRAAVGRSHRTFSLCICSTLST